jgi:hypothetical protein
MRGFPVNGDPKPAELSKPPERPPPELGYRCAQGRRLDLVDNCFWHLGDIGALANVRFAPEGDARRQMGLLRPQPAEKRMQGLLAEKTILLRGMTTAALGMPGFMILLLGGNRFCPRTASAAATSSRQSPYSEHRR